jgi:Ser/Thr protein kinase RdoA (MazF antagonist)
MTTGAHIWEALTQDNILNSLEQQLQTPLGNLCLRRNSYVNRVYEVETTTTKTRYIAKYYRPGRWTRAMITEEHAFVAELAKADIPVIPALPGELGVYTDIIFAIYPKKGGRALNEFDQETWLNLGRIIAKMHLVGVAQTSSNRISWTPTTATEAHAAILLPLIPHSHQAGFTKAINAFINRSEPLFNAEQLLVIHGDLHRGNLIHRPDEGIYIVDFDDLCVGPAIQDMWMLLPGTPEECPQELEWFISGYETFRDFPYSSLPLIPALRTMRIIHFAAWCALQRDDLDFADHFPDWGTMPYWTQLIRELQYVPE